MTAQRFGERWEIVRALAEGGQAHTFIVKDLLTGLEDWVLKRLRNPNRLGRFEQEVRALQAISSERILKVEDFSIGDPAYLVYRYVGPTLASVTKQENLTFDEGLDLLRDVAEALADAHDAGIIHRDVKPDNVVVEPNRAPGRRASLIDFGLCQWDAGGIFKTTTDEPLGNRSFAPPELELGSLDEPSFGNDVYSFGRTIYWVLTGGELFVRERLDEIALAKLPDPRGVERTHVARLLRKMVVEDVSGRIPSREVQRELEKLGRLARAGVNAVGARDQLCPTCRLGKLERLRELQNLGYTAPGMPDKDVRMLKCDNCGYLQHHFIKDTTSQREGLWEI